MAIGGQPPQIPGRRISWKEIFFTDWVSRSGDCLLVRAECLIAPSAGNLKLTLQTRGEDGTTITDVMPTFPVNPPATGVTLDSVGIATGMYLASTSSGGAKEQVRLMVEFEGGSDGDYLVARVFPFIFFDNAKP